jgi:murein DD-endopeptidase MepM/ murein hydrolase activator NlpD
MFINRKQVGKKFILLEVIKFIFLFLIYLLLRLKQFVLYLWALSIWLSSLISEVKDWIVRKMFWGRSGFYRSAFQFSVGLLTLIIALGGLTGRLNLFVHGPSQILYFPSVTLGEADYLNESSSMQAIVSNVSLTRGFEVQVYVVQRGDTLSAIAVKFGVSSDTIRWANGITGDYLRTGQSLEIPPINGVIHLVKKGDTLAKIAEKYQSSVQDIFDINWLESDALKEGQELLVPNGRMPQPKPVLPPVSAGYTAPGPVNTDGAGGTGNFIRPCGCGKITNWFSAWHGGVDIAQSGGCQIVAIDNGVVTMARWYGAGGLQIMIDHGNGYVSLYAHSSAIYVKEGDRVTRGQSISYMGCTGRCTGTHLHFGLQRNGVWVNPLAYVPI